MGRGVSKPTKSLIECYIDVSHIEEDYEWSEFKEDIAYRVSEKYPSLSECDKWLDNEDHAILENDLVYVGISENNGLVCLWVAPKYEYDEYQYEDNSGLTDQWAKSISKGFTKAFGDYARLGGFSDGTSVYEKVA